ncbi:sodium/glutamate symporter [Neorhodopirellula pilleata]|uniref:Sodium/glutamate symporter n=1 Tax=Neorhodopirellula pilleata TaxID=2714738 RepID=A0A5C6A9W1_9BACT|nr:sodium/glutamate symporter [Neorhodopirellula pilleata]TWT96226.1 Sodium/glutamate symporter [Neorhodopirellula pilleata]
MINAILTAAVLLMLGLAIRGTTRWFALARIPVSLIAGIVGLILWQAAQWAAVRFDKSSLPTVVNEFELGPMAILSSWPGWLIAVVFAGMLLVKSDKRERGGGWTAVARQGLMVWIIVVGQTTIGLWITWCLIQPRSDVPMPNSTAMLIETGFAGGHGTAAAMGTVFENPAVGLAEGLDLGILMATSGLVYGLLAGVVLVNIGVLRRWTATPVQDKVILRHVSSDAMEEVQAEPEGARSSTISEAIEPLLLQAVWLALAFGIGVGLQTIVGSVAGELDGWVRNDSAGTAGDDVFRSKLGFVSVVGSFPLFIYTLFGGWLVRVGLTRIGAADWIDSRSIESLCGASMDLLVVAAVATLNLQAVASLWWAFSMLLIGGIVWSTFCLVVLSRRILPCTHWFELGLINFGMSTGTTATGFVLLRMIDPELKTRAAEEYALAAPLSAPFIGGGMLTVGLPLLLLERIPIAASTFGFTIVLLGLIVAGILSRRHETSTAS